VIDYLRALKEAGVGSLPGTSAEILDQEIRDRIAPGRIRVDQWKEVITTAHELGIPTTSTIMYGFIENDTHKAHHLALIREMQKSTGGFTEFVPLRFVHTETPMYCEGRLQGLRPGPSPSEVVKMHAVARIVLNNWIPNIQVSWVKEGLPSAKELLGAGVNDMGGTLINESISTAAGSPFGQLVKPQSFRNLIREVGRIPAERDTTYTHLRLFDEESGLDPLDRIEENDSENQFGSYKEMSSANAYRYQHPARKPRVAGQGN
jgi:FO synthase subunit 2